MTHIFADGFHYGESNEVIIGTAMNDTKPGDFVYLEEVTSDGTKKVKLDDKRPYRNFIIRDGKS